jgi:hypothetical protein
MKLTQASKAAIEAGIKLHREHSAEVLIAATINAVIADKRFSEPDAAALCAALTVGFYALTGLPTEEEPS